MIHALRDLGRRVAGTVARATLAAIDDSTKLQTVQIALLADELADGVERFQDYGLTSVPLPDAEAVVVCVGGLRGHAIVVAVDDRRYRPTGLQPGEVCLYDDQGQRVTIKRGGIDITTTKPITIHATSVAVTADHVTVTSDDVQLGGAGGMGVARIGDAVTGGVITGGSTKVKAA